MTLITDVQLQKVLDSRGNATVEAVVHTEHDGVGRASAPSGASTGEYEAIELPADEAIAQAREHAVSRLVGQVYAGDQRLVDRTLEAADGTDDFSRIGANSAVAISMAAATAAADVLGAPLYQHLGGTFRGDDVPTPLGNVIGGGEHAAGGTHIQEYLSVPVGAPSVTDAVFANAAVHREVGTLLTDRGLTVNKGDEGAWAPAISDAEAFTVLETATETVSDELGFDIEIGLDVAASELYDGEDYQYGETTRSVDEQIDYIAGLVTDHELAYVEDPLDENDYEAFARLTDRVGEQTLICGDDLFVTNTDRLADGIEQGAANSILIKPNQIGTLSATFDAVELAVANGYDPVISHRSGETEDATIAHLAVGTAAPFIKTGAIGGERTAKLNELIRIEANA